MAKENISTKPTHNTHTSQKDFTFPNSTEAHRHLKVVRGLTKTASELEAS